MPFSTGGSDRRRALTGKGEVIASLVFGPRLLWDTEYRDVLGAAAILIRGVYRLSSGAAQVRCAEEIHAAGRKSRMFLLR